MGLLRVFVSVFTQTASTLLLFYCIVSWFLPPDSPFRQWLGGFVDPMLNPIRRIMPDFGMLDFSPIILMLILQFIQRLIS